MSSDSPAAGRHKTWQGKRKPKFKVGDVVMDTMTEEQFIVGTVLFDPCDGWEYGPERKGKKVLELTFEENLELIR